MPSCAPSATRAHGHVIILGLGNTLVSDDGVGVYAARSAASLLDNAQLSIDVREAEIGGFGLIDLLADYDHAVILDAIKLPDRHPGEIVELEASALPKASHLVSGHQIDLATALAFGAELGHTMPASVHIIAIQIENDTTFGEQLTAHVHTAVPVAAKRAVELATHMLAATP